jgi:hypothetical protein
VRLLRAFEKTAKGEELHIFCPPTEHALWKQQTTMPIHLHPLPSFIEQRAIMRRSKVFVLSDPFLRDGAREDFFYALESGATVFTHEALYPSQIFGSELNVYSYSYQAPEETWETLLPLLANEQTRQAFARAGRDLVLRAHTWRHRAETLTRLLPYGLHLVAQEKNMPKKWQKV